MQLKQRLPFPSSQVLKCSWVCEDVEELLRVGAGMVHHFRPKQKSTWEALAPSDPAVPFLGVHLTEIVLCVKSC